ncbi:MAG: CotH kinase family protein [Clostridia bacterium]|nr:CotH kinase family protein [Clostridia bacterium]
MKRVFCLLLCLLTVLFCGACNTRSELEEPDTSGYTEDTAAALPPTGSNKVPTAEIVDGIFYMFEGEMRRLNYTVHTPEGAEGEVEWASSSDSVLVENGIVYAKKEGYAIVSGGGERNCVVRVLPKTLPILNINTNGVAITSKENYVDCRVDLSTSNADYCFEGARGGIRIRGNSTSSRPKKPYRIKFDSKRNLLGMNEDAECKSWVLLAEWYDASMLHNSASLSLASVILTEYTSDWRNVNVYINGEYQGVYLLAEQSQINEYRIDIEEAGADSSEIRSGYLFEQEASSTNPLLTLDVQAYKYTNFLGTYKPHTRYFKWELKNDGTSPEQTEFAARYLKNAFKIIYAATYDGNYFALDENANIVKSKYKSAEETISALIDVDSLARKYIHSELTCNWDDRQKSYFMYVDFSEGGTGLLTFACPWDFDHAFYQYGTYKYADTEAYFAVNRNVWYAMLLNHEFIRERVAEVWQEVYANTNGFDSVLDMMLLVTRNYDADFALDEEMWNRGRDRDAELADRIIQAATGYQWLIRRIEWMNGQFSDPQFVTKGKI